MVRKIRLLELGMANDLGEGTYEFKPTLLHLKFNLELYPAYGERYRWNHNYQNDWKINRSQCINSKNKEFLCLSNSFNVQDFWDLKQMRVAAI